MTLNKRIAALLLGLFFTLGFAAQASAVFEAQRTWGATTGGTANAQTLAIANWNAIVTGVPLRGIAGFTNSGATTFAVSGTTTKNLYKLTPTGVGPLTGGELVAGQPFEVEYDGTQYVLQSPPVVSISGDFRNLKVATASDTTFTVTADALTVEASDGYAYRASSVSVTCTITNSGANGFDSGSPSSSSWISGWVIRNPGTNTQACLASASATAPTLPSGYTMKRRVGWLRYDATPKLWRTIQYGRSAQVVIGTNPTALPVIASGTGGSVATPTWVSVSVSNYVPSTASRIALDVYDFTGSGNSIVVAPNNSYGASGNASNPPYLLTDFTTGVTTTSFTLESTSIYWASSASSAGILLSGWEDNL